jgi:hypothetical protein
VIFSATNFSSIVSRFYCFSFLFFALSKKTEKTVLQKKWLHPSNKLKEKSEYNSKTLLTCFAIKQDIYKVLEKQDFEWRSFEELKTFF